MLKEKINLKNHKGIFEIRKDAVLATISEEGVSNIVPVHSKHVVAADKVLVSDQFMKKTKENVIRNPYATLAIMDQGKVYKMSGKCSYRTSGFFYAMAVRGAKKYAKKSAQNKEISIVCKGIILMKVQQLQIEEM